MSKQEFLDKLRLALSGRVSAALVEENVAYYEEYINTQIRLGKNEAFVMNGLGDPRLIAKSIITANNGDEEVGAGERGSQQYRSSDAFDMVRSRMDYPKVIKVPGWVWLIVIILIVVLVLSAVFSLISALLPFVMPLLVVLFFIKLFRDWLN